MRLIKTFTLAALAAVAAMAFVGATPASAVSTQLCTVHTGLTCGAGNGATSVHAVLAAGEVLVILSSPVVLCLGYLFEANAGLLGSGATKQTVTFTSQIFTGCGTGPAHSDCTVTTQVQPVLGLLKSGLDEATATSTAGRVRLQCGAFIDCLYDLAGMELSVGGGHLTANETPTIELGGKFICSDDAYLDALLETLQPTYVLG